MYRERERDWLVALTVYRAPHTRPVDGRSSSFAFFRTRRAAATASVGVLPMWDCLYTWRERAGSAAGLPFRGGAAAAVAAACSLRRLYDREER